MSYQAVGGFPVYFPGEIKSWMDRLDGSIQQLNTDIKASKVGDAFRDAWQSFRSRWTVFYDDHQSWWSRASVTPDEVTAYENEYNKWLIDYKKEPGASGSFAHSMEDQTLPAALNATLQAVTNAALLLGGLYLAVRYLPPLLETKKKGQRA